MTGTVVQLSFWVLRCDWLGLTGHGSSCPTEQCMGAAVCPCVRCNTGEDARVLPPKRQHH